ncbi:zinc-binding dehydrogenase [Cadophora sp. MPI-SDFR-AT-0126]|nr:zinc-binding dehydrogenase [Leotiomycetes sp. MPI-SDFR-AT-0126]
MPENMAAWAVVKGRPLEIKSAPYPTPKSNEIVVRNHSVAINPVDWLLLNNGSMILKWLKYPVILGSDLAGEVVAVGSDVKRFKVGERILSFALGITKSSMDNRQGAFQLYPIIREDMASPIPDSMSYEEASVLPLGMSTAACGLYHKDHLALQQPSTSAKSIGKTVLIWGGSTSVGSCAIQLAAASGYKVITTCSPRNFTYVKRLGASQPFDYNSPTVVQDIIAAFKGDESAGALSIGKGAVEKCLDILAKCKGSKMVAMTSYAVQPNEIPVSIIGFIPLALPLAKANLNIMWKRWMRGLETSFVSGSALEGNEVRKAVYVDFLPEALRQGKVVPSPEPLIVGKGLGKIHEAFGLQKRGVSAKKVVVSL